jgi:uncharacterized protein (DUF58 family)
LQRFILLSTIVYGLLLAGLVSLQGEFIALAIPFSLYLFYGFWNIPERLDLQIDRKLSSDRAVPGADVIVTLTIKNLGDSLEELYVSDRLLSHLVIRCGSPSYLLRLPKGSSQTVTYTIAGPRGAYLFDSVHVDATDSLGLTSRAQSQSAKGQLFVFPDIRRLVAVPIRPRRTRVYAGAIPARAGGNGTEFFGVREYQLGDAPHTINWHASARHVETLFSNEYQQERVADVALVLDARQRANLFHSTASIFEHSVSAAAALADVFISQGNRVGLLIYGGYLSWTLPGYGRIQRERILRALAGASVGASTVFAGLEHLSTRMFPPESQIVLISSLVHDDLKIVVQLRARGYQVMVISPDPIEFERAFLPVSSETDMAARIIRMERNLLIRRLERAGVQVFEWNVARPFDQALGPRLRRPHMILSQRAS